MRASDPVFFIGFPRSGTTVSFEAFCRHPLLGWPSVYTEKFPATPVVEVLRRLLDNPFVRLAGRKGQYGKTLAGNRLLPQPSEAYRFWDFHTRLDFSRGFLLGKRADEDTIKRVRAAVERLLRWQGRARFAAKLTGPPRIAFLDSIFPNCYFVHIVRDGRAAVHSLLNVEFWREKGGLEAPFWKGGLSHDEEQRWRARSHDPGVLAALQWAAVLKASRKEAQEVGQGRYLEFRYEDFVRDPHTSLGEIYGFCGLEDCLDGHAYLDQNPILGDFNQKYRRDFSPAYIEMLTSSMQPMLSELNYPI